MEIKGTRPQIIKEIKSLHVHDKQDVMIVRIYHEDELKNKPTIQ